MPNNIRKIREKYQIKANVFAETLETSVQQLRRLEVGERKLNTEWIDRITAAFHHHGFKDFKPWMLISEKGPNAHVQQISEGIAGVKVLGEVQAGVWMEAVQWDDGDTYEVPYGVPAKFADSAYGLRVIGDSMNLVYPDGTVVIVIPVWEYGDEIPSGKRVIVERRKKDGIVEATAKELEVINGHAKLWPRSTNPKFQQAIDIAWPYEEPQGIGLETVEIKGVIIGSYRSEE